MITKANKIPTGLFFCGVEMKIAALAQTGRDTIPSIESGGKIVKER